MVRHESHLPRHLDVRDPNFDGNLLQWASQAQSEMHVLVLATRRTIENSKVLIAETDRLIAWRL